MRPKCPVLSSGARADLAASLPSANSVVDVMILYTPEATNQYGGDAGLRSMAALDVGYASSILSASGAAVEIRLIYTGLTPNHTQLSTSDLELRWISTNTAVANLRTQYGADLVSEITYNLGGVAYYLNPYSVVTSDSVTFTHEIGHNFGCRHDFTNAQYCASCPSYAYGYPFTPPGGLTYGTIMSYVGLTIPYF